MTRSRLVYLAGLAAATLLVSACGSGSHRLVATSSHARAAAGRSRTGPPQGGLQVVPEPGPTGIPADPVAVRVIESWSTALRRGDIRAAAALFKLPSELVNGTGSGQADVILIRNLAQAEAANETLPCGAKFVSADQRGPYVNALFRLTGRPGPGGSNCQPGAGLTARTNFLIHGGRIVQWIRAPDDPGDNGSPPSGSTGGGPAV